MTLRQWLNAVEIIYGLLNSGSQLKKNLTVRDAVVVVFFCTQLLVSQFWWSESTYPFRDAIFQHHSRKTKRQRGEMFSVEISFRFLVIFTSTYYCKKIFYFRNLVLGIAYQRGHPREEICSIFDCSSILSLDNSEAKMSFFLRSSTYVHTYCNSTRCTNFK